MNKRTKKMVSIHEALAKARKYCALNERSKEEVSRKLDDYGVMKGDVPDIIEKLTQEGFINEKRFAAAFAGGKFRMKKWGRIRIRMEMKKRGLSNELISAGLTEVRDKEYQESLDKLLAKKLAALQRQKKAGAQIFASLVRYAVQKGYEHQLVMDRVRKLGHDEEA